MPKRNSAVSLNDYLPDRLCIHFYLDLVRKVADRSFKLLTSCQGLHKKWVFWGPLLGPDRGGRFAFPHHGQFQRQFFHLLLHVTDLQKNIYCLPEKGKIYFEL